MSRNTAIVLVILMVGVLAAISVPRYSKAVNNVKVMAAHADLAQYVQALEMYYIDRADYPHVMGGNENLSQYTGKVLVDPCGNTYTRLNTSNFRHERGYGPCFYYQYYPTICSYMITVRCKDAAKTILTATPDGIIRY